MFINFLHALTLPILKVNKHFCQFRKTASFHHNTTTTITSSLIITYFLICFAYFFQHQNNFKSSQQHNSHNDIESNYNILFDMLCLFISTSKTASYHHNNDPNITDYFDNHLLTSLPFVCVCQSKFWKIFCKVVVLLSLWTTFRTSCKSPLTSSLIVTRSLLKLFPTSRLLNTIGITPKVNSEK